MEETSIQDRLDRAESRETTFSCVAFDPLVYTVETDHSDDVHTIVPEILHCSCPDATYRNGPCYHLLSMAMQNGHAGVEIRERLEKERSSAQSAVNFHKEQLDEKQDKLRRLQTALDGIDDRTDPSDPDYTLELGSNDEPVDTEAIDAFADELGVGSDNDESESETTEQPRDENGRFLSPEDRDEAAVEVSTAETNDEFRSLVNDLRGDAE